METDILESNLAVLGQIQNTPDPAMAHKYKRVGIHYVYQEVICVSEELEVFFVYM